MNEYVLVMLMILSIMNRIKLSNYSCKKRSPPVSSSQVLTRFRK